MESILLYKIDPARWTGQEIGAPRKVAIAELLTAPVQCVSLLTLLLKYLPIPSLK